MCIILYILNIVYN